MADRRGGLVNDGVLVFAIAAVVVAAVFAFGTVTQDLFATSSTTIRDATTVGASAPEASILLP